MFSKKNAAPKDDKRILSDSASYNFLKTNIDDLRISNNGESLNEINSLIEASCIKKLLKCKSKPSVRKLGQKLDELRKPMPMTNPLFEFGDTHKNKEESLADLFNTAINQCSVTQKENPTNYSSMLNAIIKATDVKLLKLLDPAVLIAAKNYATQGQGRTPKSKIGKKIQPSKTNIIEKLDIAISAAVSGPKSLLK